MKTSYQPKIKNFKFENVYSSVRFVESMEVKEGVYCDAYEFNTDNDKDY